MRKLLKIITLLCCLLLFACIGGCSKSKLLAITLNVDTGDSVKITLDSSEGHKITFDKETNIVSITSGEEESIAARGIFVPENSYSMYYETAYTDDRCNVIENGKENGISYTFYNYDDGKNLNCEYIGWIEGTNTGIVFESTTLSTEESRKLFQKLSFSVESTEQENKNYIYQPNISGIGQEENTEKQDDEILDDTEEIQETEQNLPVEDWTSMEIKIDGELYNFPYSFHKLQEQGWDFDISEYLEEGEEEYILNEGEYTYSTTKLMNEKYGYEHDSACIYAGFKNFNEEPKDIIECDLWAIEVCGVYGAKKIDNCPDIELPGGIKFGDSYDKIIETYGKPNEEFNQDYYKQIDYENNYDEHMTLYIYEEKGLLDAEFRKYQ